MEREICIPVFCFPRQQQKRKFMIFSHVIDRRWGALKELLDCGGPHRSSKLEEEAISS